MRESRWMPEPRRPWSIEGKIWIEGAERPRIESETKIEREARDWAEGEVWGGGSVSPQEFFENSYSWTCAFWCIVEAKITLFAVADPRIWWRWERITFRSHTNSARCLWDLCYITPQLPTFWCNKKWIAFFIKLYYGGPKIKPKLRLHLNPFLPEFFCNFCPKSNVPLIELRAKMG